MKKYRGAFQLIYTVNHPNQSGNASLNCHTLKKGKWKLIQLC